MRDRELDAWLAEHLLGLEVIAGPNGTNTAPDLTGSGDGAEMVIAAMRERGYSFMRRQGFKDEADSVAFVKDGAVSMAIADRAGFPMATVGAAQAAIQAEGGRDA